MTMLRDQIQFVAGLQQHLLSTILLQIWKVIRLWSGLEPESQTQFVVGL